MQKYYSAWSTIPSYWPNFKMQVCYQRTIAVRDGEIYEECKIIYNRNTNKDIFIQRGTYVLVLNKHIIPTLRSYFLNNCSYVFNENSPANIKPHISLINQSSVMSKIICLTQMLLGWIGPFPLRLISHTLPVWSKIAVKKLEETCIKHFSWGSMVVYWVLVSSVRAKALKNYLPFSWNSSGWSLIYSYISRSRLA